MKAVGLLKLPFCMKNKSKYFLTIYQIAFVLYESNLSTGTVDMSTWLFDLQKRQNKQSNLK